MVRRLFQVGFVTACALFIVQETGVGSLLFGVDCVETCPDELSDGRCSPACTACSCTSHGRVVALATAGMSSDTDCAGPAAEPRETLPVAPPPVEIFHVPKSILS